MGPFGFTCQNEGRQEAGPEQRLQTCQSLDRKFKQTSCLPGGYQRLLWQRDGQKSSHRNLQFAPAHSET